MSNSNAILPDTAPFTPDQLQWLNGFLATLQPDQLGWLEGFISGLRAGQGQVVPVPDSIVAAPQLTVLFGSESGNAEGLAYQTVKAATKAGFKANALSMADSQPATLKGIENLLVLVSTWGEGDPPENAVDFVDVLMSDAAPRLEGTRFSVFGLGDSSYEHFCKTGIDLDARLETLGAQRVCARRDCDVDFDDDFATWHAAALAALSSFVVPLASSGRATIVPAPKPVSIQYSRKHPFPAALNKRILLNGGGSAKETIHLEFNLEGSGLEYTAGDALAVIPRNAEDVVDSILDATKLDGMQMVSLKDGDYTLNDALTGKLDVTILSLPVLKRYNTIATDDQLDALLQPDNKAQLQDYMHGREIIDVLIDFPAKALTAEGLTGIMRKLPPRLYSIASSPKAHPGEVHLTVGVVRYHTNRRQRKGVCSSFLADPG